MEDVVLMVMQVPLENVDALELTVQVDRLVQLDNEEPWVEQVCKVVQVKWEKQETKDLRVWLDLLELKESLVKEDREVKKVLAERAVHEVMQETRETLVPEVKQVQAA